MKLIIVAVAGTYVDQTINWQNDGMISVHLNQFKFV